MPSLPAERPAPPVDRLALLGERTRALRARRGLTRKALARAAGVSERHLANVESGVGNASVQFLGQLAEALACPIAELLGDETTSSPEWLMVRELLRGRSDAELARARIALDALFGADAAPAVRRRERIALIGLRGAGKSTLGRALADGWGVPFVELNRVVERLAGCTLPEIHALYGPAAYRRHERRALDETVGRHARAVVATPGGIVSDPATFARLLASCFTVWLRATPEEHMDRVLAQGDLRPMGGRAGDAEAMRDLRRILDSRTAFYARADLIFDTSGLAPEQAVLALRDRLVEVLSA